MPDRDRESDTAVIVLMKYRVFLDSRLRGNDRFFLLHNYDNCYRSENEEEIPWDRDAGFPFIPFDSQSFATKPRSRRIQAVEYSDDSLTMRNG